jgi:glycosyltransferase involved in cell wall biosynthesis/SAM-dependent methyltransferase
MIACTIVARNYLAQARVLARSFAHQHDGGEMFVLVIDDLTAAVGDAQEPFVVVRPAELDLPEFLRMATMYDVTELATAVKPAFLLHLLERTGKAVLYLDPDIEVFGCLDEVEGFADAHGLVLTPHLIQPLPHDDKQPADLDILVSGAFNLGFVAVAPREDVLALLKWWHERLSVDCIIDHANGHFVDQRWMDLSPGFVSDLLILRDPGYNVAYWNLGSRRVELEDGRYTVNGAPLRFMHYSGFDPDHPLRLSRHQTRERLVALPLVADLFERYGSLLAIEARSDVDAFGYGFDQSADGLVLHRWLRRLYREGVRDRAITFAAFDPDGAAQLRAWLGEPASRGARAGLNRVAEWIWRGRADLQAAYPDLDGEDAVGYAGWLHVDGRLGYAGLEEFLPAPPDFLRGDPRFNPNAVGANPPARVVRPWGVNVVGYLRSELGVGEAARLVIASLDAHDVPTMPVHGSFVPSSRQGHGYDFVAPEDAPFPVNLICVNADLLPTFVAETPDAFFAGRHQIGLWWWEVERFPQEWMGAFDLVDEVWVASQHIADTLMPLTSVPIVKVTLPVIVPDPPRRTREELGLPQSFVFFFMFDFNSVMERKNPLGLIEAFKQAFPPGSGPSLVIKSINADLQPDEHAAVMRAVGDHPEIQLWDGYVSGDDKASLLASVDCYVSLHRAEGFGLTPAESMFLGKPVIATGYSGNLEFMTDQNSYLVRHAMVGIGDGAWPYPAAGIWAEPDLGHAAELMRRVVEQPAEAARRGARGAADLRRLHSPLAAGTAMARRLDVIRSRLAAYPTTHVPSVGLSLDTVEDRVRRHAGDPTGSVGGYIRAKARGGVLRAIRPYTAHEDAFSRDVVEALNEVSGVVDRIDQGMTLLAGKLGKVEADNLAHRRRAARIEEELRRLRGDMGLLRDDSKLEQSHRDLVGSHKELAGSHQELVRSHEELFAAYVSLLADTRELADSHRQLTRELHARADRELLPFAAFDVEPAGRVYGFGPGGARPDGGLYRDFEDLFRGEEGTIRERQKIYLSLIGTSGPVLDVGCGRGEFLDLLAQRGIPATGIDLDAHMIARCHEKGHADAQVADANEHLESRPPASLGVVFSAQVIEHLNSESLERFLRLSLSRLRPGGMFIAETVNPHSLAALKNFWLDLTHEHPIFPEVALALGRIVGFDSAYVFYPNASGDAEVDMYHAGDYALVAIVSSEPGAQ